MLTPKLCKIARILLDWEQINLSQLIGVSKQTISNFESGRNTPQASTMEAMQEAFKYHGIEFVIDYKMGIEGAIRHPSGNE